MTYLFDMNFTLISYSLLPVSTLCTLWSRILKFWSSPNFFVFQSSILILNKVKSEIIIFLLPLQYNVIYNFFINCSILQNNIIKSCSYANCDIIINTKNFCLMISLFFVQADQRRSVWLLFSVWLIFQESIHRRM